MSGGDGQRPPVQDEAPEPGNARFPAQAQPGGQGGGGGGGGGQGGQPGQPGEGGGRRRFRRQRRGGRGRGRNKGGGGGSGQANQNQPGYAPPLDAQGRIYDVENEADDGEGDDDVPGSGDGQAGGPPQQAGAMTAAPPAPRGNEARAPAPAAPAIEANGNQAVAPPPPPPPPTEGNFGTPAVAQPPPTQATGGGPVEGAAVPAASSAAPPEGAQAQPGQPGAPAQPQQNGQPQPGQGNGQPQQGGQHGQHNQQRGQHGQHNRHQNRHNQNANQQGGQGQQGAPNQQRGQQQRQAELTTPAEGYLDIDHRGNGRLRQQKLNFLPQPDDAEVPRHLIDRDRLRPGVMLTGQSVRRNGRPQLTKIDTVEGLPPAQAAARTLFQNLTVIDPDDRLIMETTSKEILTRVIDIVSPIGLGQRALIVAPPKTGKTIMLQKISHAVTINRPDVIQMVLLVDERPEEVTDFRRTVKAEVYASSSDRPTEEHLQVAEMAMERAKRLVEGGKDVVILLDSITRLSRAYNKEVESSGRTLSGGVDSRALERPKRLFGAARNAEEGGSLTIIATALIDTGSRMDEVIFEEFKGTGNLEINLDRQLAEKRIFPAINIQTSGTRKEEKLFSNHEYEKIKKLRGALFSLKPVEAMERLIKSIGETTSNAEFLDLI